jgi:GTP cyclohydrolase I
MSSDKKARLEALVAEMLDLISPAQRGREGLLQTPARVAKMWLEELSPTGVPPELTEFESPLKAGEGWVQMSGVEFWSTCEHHMLPFFGTASVAYVPNTRIVGLSKVARIVDYFARRLTTQEELTDKVVSYLYEHLEPVGICVVTDARHACMEARGVKNGASTRVVSHRGYVDNEDLRAFSRLMG